MSLIRHKYTGDKQIRLIATETGEELAPNYKQAQSAGLLGKLKEEEVPGKESDSSRGGPQRFGGKAKAGIVGFYPTKPKRGSRVCARG